MKEILDQTSETTSGITSVEEGISAYIDALQEYARSNDPEAAQAAIAVFDSMCDLSANLGEEIDHALIAELIEDEGLDDANRDVTSMGLRAISTGESKDETDRRIAEERDRNPVSVRRLPRT